MDEYVEHSRQSWRGDFTERFSWWPPFVRSLEFPNNYYLLEVHYSALRKRRVLFFSIKTLSTSRCQQEKGWEARSG